MKHVKKAHFLSLALIVGCVLVVRAEYDAQFNARIDEIAGWLPEEPRADGARIADRKSWDCLARSANGSEAVKQAEKVMYAKWDHPLYKRLGEDAKRQGGHGGMDYIMLCRIIECLHNGEPMDQNVYEGALWSAVGPLSEKSVNEGGAPQEFPDFTRGGWKTTPPLPVVE